MQQYKDLVEHIVEFGDLEVTRAKLESTGEHARAVSVFGPQMAPIDLSKGFPLLTTKKMPFKAIAHELIWFLNGDTNVKYLQENGVHIWDQWAEEDGNVGKIYGKQWRNWVSFKIDRQGGLWTCVTDQIQNIADTVKRIVQEPTYFLSRRLILTAWNVNELDEMNLPPCHVLSQFKVSGNRLHCKMYQRSADLFLGVPFNIASYALLTHLLAHLTGLEPGKLICTYGDCHIYENHMDQIREQLDRPCLTLPTVSISDRVKEECGDLKGLKVEDFILENYQSAGPLKGEVAV